MPVAASQKIHATVSRKKSLNEPNSNVEELINNAEVHKYDPVTHEEEFFHSHSGIAEKG